MTIATDRREHSLAKDGFPKDGLQLYDRSVEVHVLMATFFNDCDRARPTYPADCLSFIRQSISDRNELNIVE